MVKVYPEKYQISDEIYDIMRTIICGLLFCVCICVGLIIIIAYSVENNIENGSSYK